MNLEQQDSVTHLVPAFTRLSKLESMMIDDDLAGRDKLVTSEEEVVKDREVLRQLPRRLFLDGLSSFVRHDDDSDS
jgi:hypothetical protein